MLGYLHRFSRHTGGSILPLTAVLLPVIIGMGGVAIDVSAWSMKQRSLQTAADAAAIAAAWEIANNMNDYAPFAAEREAQNNGYDPSQDGHIQLSLDDVGGALHVTATVSQRAPIWFSAIFIKDVYTAASATTAILSTGGGSYCLLSLDQEADGAISVVGNATLESQACGMAVNSDSSSALDLRGNVKLDIGDVNIAGDYAMQGNVTFHYANLKTHAGRVADPYEDLEVPDIIGCDYTNHTISGSGTHTLWPGTYCGGISITGNNTVYMEPGVYILDGGKFDIGGGGKLLGEGVTIILTSTSGSNWGTLDLTGGKDIYIAAPKEGESEWAGVAIYHDRNAPTATHKLTGNGSVEFDGVAYLPSQHMDFGGNKSLANPNSSCSHIIASTIHIHGNPHMESDCEGWGVRTTSEVSVRLIM